MARRKMRSRRVRKRQWVGDFWDFMRMGYVLFDNTLPPLTKHDEPFNKRDLARRRARQDKLRLQQPETGQGDEQCDTQLC